MTSRGGSRIGSAGGLDVVLARMPILALVMGDRVGAGGAFVGPAALSRGLPGDRVTVGHLLAGVAESADLGDLTVVLLLLSHGGPVPSPAFRTVAPVEYVEIARSETERGELVLRERRDENAPAVLELRANGVFVMDTLEVSTERTLATAALKAVENPRAVVVGGLGLGFTMHEVLADSRVEKCAVVEIEQALVDWMRDGTVAHGPAMMADQRIHVVVADIAVALAEAPSAAYDLILLDVDNGPGYLVHDANDALYRPPFLQAARRATAGVLAIWSAAEAPQLQAAMAEVFGEVTATSYDVTLGHPPAQRDEHYWLYWART